MADSTITVDFSAMGDWLTDMAYGTNAAVASRNSLKTDSPFTPATHSYTISCADTEQQVYTWVASSEKNVGIQAIYNQLFNSSLYHGKEKIVELTSGASSGVYLNRLLMKENPIAGMVTVRLTKEENGVTLYQDYVTHFNRTLTLKDMTAQCDGAAAAPEKEDGTKGFAPGVKTYSVTVSMAAQNLELRRKRSGLHGGTRRHTPCEKYTEYSRVILAWTAMGRDATDVGGFNLLTPLADFDQTVFQGINGPIFALLALDSGAYDIPENTAGTTQATRDRYVDYILGAELPGGGWSFAGGDPETDITAMALQALAKYRDRQDVADAVERGLTVLSQQQEENGGYAAYGSESSESIAQVIVALTELGVSLTDSRFVKGGNTLVGRLLAFRTENGAFRHVLDGEEDVMATEQGFYALVAVSRAEQGKSSLYTMTEA